MLRACRTSLGRLCHSSALSPGATVAGTFARLDNSPPDVKNFNVGSAGASRIPSPSDIEPELNKTDRFRGAHPLVRGNVKHGEADPISLRQLRRDSDAVYSGRMSGLSRGTSALRRPRQVKHGSKFRLPSQPRDLGPLYEAVVYQDAARIRGSTHPLAIAEHARAPASIEEDCRETLRELRRIRDTSGMLNYLAQMEEQGRPPSHWALACTLGLCAVEGNLSDAEQLFEKMQSSPDTRQRHKYMTSARVTLAMRYASQREPEKVLAILGWSHEAADIDLNSLIQQLDFRRDTFAWGLLMWGLVQVKRPHDTIQILHFVNSQGIALTDSLCHLGIEAYGAMGSATSADKLFRELQDLGITPGERSIGSLLRTLTGPGTKRNRRYAVDTRRLCELVALVSDPSIRFVTTSLLAFANVALLDEAERSFDLLVKKCNDGIPDERAFMVLMRCYATRLLMEAPEDTPEGDVASWYANIVERADTLWTLYLTTYGYTMPHADAMHARSTIFPKYILIKALGLQLPAALALLQDALRPESIAGRPFLKPTPTHFASFFTGLERTCDANMLESALTLMTQYGIPMNDSCLASAVGTLIFHGDPTNAAKLVLSYASDVSDQINSPSSIQNRLRLLNRVKLLQDALHQGPRASSSEWMGLRSSVQRVAASLRRSIPETG